MNQIMPQYKCYYCKLEHHDLCTRKDENGIPLYEIPDDYEPICEHDCTCWACFGMFEKEVV